MSAGQAGSMIIAIGSRDDFLHVYNNDQELLEDDKIGAGDGEQTGPLEFFDSAGYRLVGEYDQQWRLRALTRTTDAPALAHVRQRVQNCLDHVRSYLKGHPEQAEPLHMTVDEVLALVPDLGEPAEFDTSLKALLSHSGRDEVAEGGIELMHWKPDPVHMFRHAGGWQH